MPLLVAAIEASDMDQLYPGFYFALKDAKAKGLHTVVPEDGYTAELYDEDLGVPGQVVPMPALERIKALADGVDAVVRPPTPYDKELLNNYRRYQRPRKDAEGFDDSDDDGTSSSSDVGWEDFDLRCQHATVIETKAGPRWHVDDSLEREAIRAQDAENAAVAREQEDHQDLPASGAAGALAGQPAGHQPARRSWRDLEE